MEHREAKPTKGSSAAKRADTVQTVSRNTQKDNYHILLPAELNGENDDVIPRNDDLMHEVNTEDPGDGSTVDESLWNNGKMTDERIWVAVAVTVGAGAGAGVGLLLFFLFNGSSLDGHTDGFQNITEQTPDYPSTNSNELSRIIEQMDSLSPKIDLSGKNITEILPDAFINLKNLRTVFLRNNRELVIPTDKVWIYHPSIMYIDLSDCNLGPLNPVVFEGLDSLRLVYLAGNDGGCETRGRVLLSNATYQIRC